MIENGIEPAIEAQEDPEFYSLETILSGKSEPG